MRLRKGDRVRIVNLVRLKQFNHPDHSPLFGEYATVYRKLPYTPSWLKSEEIAYEINLDKIVSGYKDWYLPQSCLELVDVQLEWKKGDKAILVNEKVLERVSLGYHHLKGVILERLVQSRSGCPGLTDEEAKGGAWWVKDEATGTLWYVPTQCLQRDMGPLERKTTAVENRKEIEQMNRLYTVTVVKAPSQLQEQAGSNPEIVVPAKQIIAGTADAACLIIGAQNADVINSAITDKARLCVVAKVAEIDC